MTSFLRQARTRYSNLNRSSRTLLIFATAVFILLCLYSSREIQSYPEEVVEQHVIKQSNGVYRIPKGQLPSVNLVVAATSKEDYSWVKDLKVPGMVVVPYIADNTSAPHHAVKNKGHEAMMYHQYFYDFYDNLPDISILIHSQAMSWHVEQLLDQSMIFSINHLDLREVQRRQFVNLRVTWGIGCSTLSINTTKVTEESGTQPEQKEMQEAFRANFNIYDIPEILATPCCSQIAVTREKILSVPRAQYQHHVDWLANTRLPDSISGRTWEHMWQYLFLGKAIDCPLEHKAYCRLYHICFGGREEYDEWIELMQGREKLERGLRKIREEEEMGRKDEEEEKCAFDEEQKKEEEQAKRDKKAWKKEEWRKEGNEKKEKARAKMKVWLEEELGGVREAIRVRREVAVVRGSVESNRVAEGENLYGDELEPGVEKKILPPPTSTALAIGTGTANQNQNQYGAGGV
ncbi:hypothetical protein EG329_003818 [Mollisiaceae sp. DMI_Dod_QoI]|nr:hypothetical protein EG329_003818 [Helotiales sp. DMI_Dod_QoI]